MKVAIHQPNYAPWLGYFQKMASADLLILLDDVQFTKNSFTNRVRIAGGRWLTVPVRATSTTLIRDVVIADEHFAARHRGQLDAAYPPSECLTEFLKLESDFQGIHLLEINLQVLAFIRERLGITTPMLMSSDVKATGRSTERLVNLIRMVGGTRYLSGGGGSKYQDPEAFARAGIRLEYIDWQHPEYDQGDSEFMPGLSALDAIFHCGCEAGDLLAKS